MSVPQFSRGERNKNPGNIDRNGTKWKGMSADQSGDSRFVVFDAPLWGIRAIGRILLTYSHAYAQNDPRNVDTVREIVNKWAPPVENNTTAYVSAVAAELGVLPDSHIDVTDPVVMSELVKAIIRHENGRVLYTDADIKEGVAMALA